MKGLKTGIISDARMLDHKSKKKHPESPARLKTILEMLDNTSYLTHQRIEYISTYQRSASNEELSLVYPDKYVQYVDNLWPKASHRTDLTILDTYFNKHTSKIARISCGGVLEGIDNVMKERWSNGFSLIRPPGHHSGAKNTINGFCIYNNIAIGAKYVQKKYNLKRVAIFDYDIHQGDGTHAIFQNDPSVLFISTHRHDRGSFYPVGDGGNYPNVGKGQGEGFSLNIPLNYVDKDNQQYKFQSHGDNQFIYLYKRLIEPVLKEFDPEFILISSGFDGARFDPLGGCNITPNGYFYMTKKLLELSKPLLCVLQGGYNFKSTAESALAVVKGLLNEQKLPEDVKNLKFQDLQYECHIEEQYHEQFDEMIDFFSKYWKSLREPQLIQYTNKIKSNPGKRFGVVKKEGESSSSSSEQQEQVQKVVFQEKVYKDISNQEQNVRLKKIHEQENKSLVNKNSQSDEESTTQFYFASGHMQRFKDFSLQKDRFLKWVYPDQLKFYQSAFPELEFAPKYYGKEGEYAILQNILYNQKEHIVLDIKLSRRSKYPKNTEQKRLKQQKKQKMSTSEKYSFRIGGFTTPEYKEGGILISSEETNKKLLAKVVTKENKDLFGSFLQGMKEQLKKVNRHYYGTSILLVKGKERSNIKWIDFHYWIDDCESYDHDIIEGIQNLATFIQDIKAE